MQLTDDNLKKIIAFSDRPYRLVVIMTAKQLQDLWREGKNSFKVDPPNAVLSASGVGLSIVILESMTINNGQLTYTVMNADRNNGSLPQVKLNDVTLIIDDLPP